MPARRRMERFYGFSAEFAGAVRFTVEVETTPDCEYGYGRRRTVRSLGEEAGAQSRRCNKDGP